MNPVDSAMSSPPAQRRYPRWVVLLAVMCGALAATVVSLVASAAMSDAVGEAAYVPLTPDRILDTRVGFQQGDFSTPWPANTTRSLTVTGVGGVPLTGVEAVVLNITTVNPSTPSTSFLSVFPTGGINPGTASLNFVNGEIKNDIVIATVGTGGQIDIYNQLGTVDLVIDVNGYYTSTVEARLAQVESLLAGLSRENVDGQDTLRLTGANLQIVNGTGTTYDTANATGNLIIGYNGSDADIRTGSHNLIVGDEHSYTANGTAVFGHNNTTSANSAAVTGGAGNTASGEQSAVSGGAANTASATWSSASGGQANDASGGSSSVSGGVFNVASGFQSSVSGGSSNTASGADCAAANEVSSVSGGRNNVASGCYSWVGGGGGSFAAEGNKATGDYSSVGGGWKNVASGLRASVAGGDTNTASGPDAVVSGGGMNTASANNASVSGGFENTASGDSASVTGGRSNTASGTTSAVSGGLTRSVTGTNDWRAGTLFEGN